MGAEREDARVEAALQTWKDNLDVPRSERMALVLAAADSASASRLEELEREMDELVGELEAVQGGAEEDAQTLGAYRRAFPDCYAQLQDAEAVMDTILDYGISLGVEGIGKRAHGFDRRQTRRAMFEALADYRSKHPAADLALPLEVTGANR